MLLPPSAWRGWTTSAKGLKAPPPVQQAGTNTHSKPQQPHLWRAAACCDRLQGAMPASPRQRALARPHPLSQRDHLCAHSCVFYSTPPSPSAPCYKLWLRVWLSSDPHCHALQRLFVAKLSHEAFFQFRKRVFLSRPMFALPPSLRESNAPCRYKGHSGCRGREDLLYCAWQGTTRQWGKGGWE